MTRRTGMGDLETTVLQAVRRLGREDGRARADVVLDALEDGVGYYWPIVQSLAVPWRLHRPVLEADGNVGFWNSGPAADPEYVRLRLSRFGRLALRVEDGDLGAAPFGLIEGSAYKGGWRPAFEPERVTSALRGLLADGNVEAAATAVGLPASPTGSELRGDLGALMRGEHTQYARLTETCRIHHEQDRGRDLLVIDGIPMGVSEERVGFSIIEESQRAPSRVGPGGTGWIADLHDETSARAGIRIVVLLKRGADIAGATAWLRSIDPVSVDVRRELPAPLDDLLRGWADAIRPDPSGLSALHALL